MKKFGLIGHPIAHSLSPALFKAAYDGKYPYDLIEGDDFEVSYQRFIDEYEGINVTAPFKELAFGKAEFQSPGCHGTGAANILIKGRNGQIEASNSDITGVIGALTSNADLTQTNTNALVVGCGGAAMAAAYALTSIGYHTTIINRNEEKAKVVAKRISDALSTEVSASRLPDFKKLFGKSGVIVYCLPVAIEAIGLLTKQEIRGTLFGKGKAKILLEANYKDPAFSSEVIDRFREINPNFAYIDGKEWLLHQAIDAYRIFTSEEPDIEAMRKVII